MEIAAIITASATVLGAVGAGIKWLIELLLSQSRSTITELREENKELESQVKDLMAGKGGTP